MLVSKYTCFTWAWFIRRIFAVSNSIFLIKFDRNSTSESAAEFLPHVRLVLSNYPEEMRHRFKRRISAVLNLIQNEKPSRSSSAILDTPPLSHLLLPDRHCSINSKLSVAQVRRMNQQSNFCRT